MSFLFNKVSKFKYTIADIKTWMVKGGFVWQQLLEDWYTQLMAYKLDNRHFYDFRLQ